MHVGCPVDLSVFQVPRAVIVEFLNHSDGEDKDEWRHKGNEETDPERRDDLRQGDQQEEHVEEVLELVEKDDWNEGVPRVLAVIDCVTWVPLPFALV